MKPVAGPRSFDFIYVPWPISVTHAIICTGHPIFKTCHTINTYLMPLSPQIMLLSHTSCYYQQKSCYYQTFHAIIHKTYVFIVQNVLLSDTSTNHVIIKQLMLLSTPQPIILTLHIILLFPRAALAHCGATGRALA